MTYTPNYQNIMVGNESTPKPQIGAMVGLPYIVANIQNELDDYSPQLYKRAMQIVIDGVREIRMYHQSSIQVAYIAVPDSGIVNYPPDYIAYTKIGMPINGQIITLTVNNNMILNRATVCGEDLRKIRENYPSYAATLTNGYYFAPHYRNGAYVGALYGAGGGFNQAYFREDKAAQQFQFDGIIPYIGDERVIVMEYESTGINEGTLLGPECVEPLKNWYYWKTSRHRKDVPANRIAMYKEDWEQSVIRLRAFTQQINISEFLDLLYANFKQSPKQ